MMNQILFFLVILLSNIVQGITGFAGTVLAMPPSLMLVGYPIAKPVLNVLGLLSGIYVFIGNRRNVCLRELKKIVVIMAAGVFCGIAMKGLFAGKELWLYRLLGVFIICVSIHGWFFLGTEVKNEQEPCALLVLAGIAHGIFVSGGPLLISYLTKRIRDKVSFRATISAVWIFLNSLILLDDIRVGLWNRNLLKIQLCSIPCLLIGMFIGGRLYARMSQNLFMRITYILLLISGISLMVK